MNSHSGRSIKKLYQRSVKALRRSKHKDVLLMTQEIIERQADHAGAHAVQFSSLFKSKKFELARLMGNQAAELNPKSVFILNNQACLELDQKNPMPAATLLTSLIDQYGERAQWLYNLGLAYELIGKHENAISLFRRTLDQDPKHEKAAQQLSESLEKIGHFEEATQAFNYWRVLQSSSDTSHGQYIHCAATSDNISLSSLQQELNLWGDKFIPNGGRYECDEINSDQPITIGFISSHIDYQWLERIVIPVANKLAENGDRILFYTHAQKVKLNENITIVNAQGLSDSDFARRVRDDQVDVLIDLCGMRKGNRQRALGLQLASKQFSWLGHEGAFATSRLTMLDDKVDHVFSDRSLVLKSDDSSSEEWPSKTFAGIAANNGLSFNVIKAWAAILLRCPDWSLNISNGSLNSLALAKTISATGSEKLTLTQKKNEQVENLLAQRFSAAGISRDRLTFNNNLTQDKTTIALDNFTNNDPISFGESLLCGATIVSLDGILFTAKKNARLMKQLGMQEFVSNSQPDFIERAVELANGTQKMSPLKSAKKHQKVLTDVDSFAKSLRLALLS